MAANRLVNPSSTRQLAGRPKTDRLDAQWIARLAEMGLLRPSFVPPPEIRALRDLTRARLQLVRDRTREWQRLEKLLEGALVKLSSVVSSLAGTKTARDILEAIAGGERDPKAWPPWPPRTSPPTSPPGPASSASGTPPYLPN
jgi:transposase